jgi:hypothetical protein
MRKTVKKDRYGFVCLEKDSKAIFKAQSQPNLLDWSHFIAGINKFPAIV